MTGNIVRYGTFEIDALDKQDETVDELAGSPFMDLEVGENVVRFLPPMVGVASPFRVTAMHYVDAIPGLDRTVAFACPRHELKESCLACAEAARLMQSPNPIDRERGKKMEAGLRVYANVVNRKRPGTGVKILGFGKMIWTQLKEIRKSPRLGGDFTNPTASGFDTVIVKTGEKMTTKYNVSADRASSPLAATDEEIALIMESQHNLEAQVNPVLPDELLHILRAASMRGEPQRVSGDTQAPAQRVGASVMGRNPQTQTAASQDKVAVVQTTGSAVDDAKSFSDDDDDDFGA